MIAAEASTLRAASRWRSHRTLRGQAADAEAAEGREERLPPLCQPVSPSWPAAQGPGLRTASLALPRMAEVCYIIYTSSMALSIKSDEADQLARELAAETGETLTEAVVIALRERLDREHARHVASMRTRLARLAADVATLPAADSRAPEEIIGYDDAGLPR